MGYQIGGGIRAHIGTTFGWNTIITCKVICNYLQKITPICCYTHRVNSTWQEAYRGMLIIEPQTFCGLKEIELRP